MTRRVVLASCTAMPQGDGDDAGLVEALATHGVRARWAPWGTPIDADELVVLRATWDYADDRPAFLDWCASLPKLVNPYKVVQQNTDKRYLVRLADAGIPVVPTVTYDPGAELECVSDDFVIKPAVGAGSRGCGRFRASDIDAARAHLRSLHAQEVTALVQPYQRAVDIHGETSLVFFRGAYSHTFTKGPMLQGGVVDTGGAVYLAEDLGAADTDPSLVKVAQNCLTAAADDAGVMITDLVYARVDLVRGDEGPLLLEMELTEPGLGFPHAEPAAIQRFAGEIGSCFE